MYLRHGLRRPNAAGVWGVGHGTQNSLLAIAHRILTTATPFCALFPPPAALANVPLSTREPWTYGAKSPRRQSRQAASRTAGTSDRSRQPTGDPRPSSQRPRKSQEGAEAPSWFPPPAERTQIIFRRGVYVTKNPSHEATCGRGPPRKGRSSSAPKRSGKSSSQRPQRGAGSGSPRPNVPRYIWAKFFIAPPPGTPRRWQ